MYLNIPIQCPTIYEKIIEKLQKCKSGIDLGHPDLGQGCLIEVSNTIIDDPNFIYRRIVN